MSCLTQTERLADALPTPTETEICCFTTSTIIPKANRRDKTPPTPCQSQPGKTSQLAQGEGPPRWTRPGFAKNRHAGKVFTRAAGTCYLHHRGTPGGQAWL